MPNAGYQNFDLEFYEAEGLYHVKARSFNGEAKHQFALPFTLDDAKKTILKIENSLADHTLNLEVVKKFGGDLFEAVFQKEVRANFKSSLDLTRVQGGEGLRLRLHLQDVPVLSHLPWEFLYDATTNQFLCFNRQTPLVRYLDLPKAILPLQIQPPLRLLVMVSSPAQLAYLNADEEKAKLQGALGKLEKSGRVQLHWLEKATVDELQKTLRTAEFHVFHFIGHGDFDATLNQGWLAFEDEIDALDEVNAEQLGAILNNHRSLRLVVLNSCKGGRTALTNPFASTAATLVQLGIPAVVAMQFAISDKAAIKFADKFYDAIADGLPVDMAATETRVALFSGDHHLEWGTPVLFMRSSDGSLFAQADQPAPAPPPPQKPAGVANFIYALVTLLVAAVTFVILAVLPKSAVMEINVFAQGLSFSLPAASGEENVSLLYSGLWTESLSLEKFMPIKLNVASLATANTKPPFASPITFTPEPLNGRITFLSEAEHISLQELICADSSQVSLQHRDGNLHLTIQQSPETPYARLSFEEEVGVLVQACGVVDASGRDLGQLFNDTVRVQLHDIYRSLRVQGQNGALKINARRETNADTVQFLVQQPVVDLDFTKQLFQGTRTIPQPTIDSIVVSRNFPLTNFISASPTAGELELTPKPNRFLINDLLAIAHGFEVRAQGRFTSMTIGRGNLKEDLVPGYLSFITENQTASLLMTWLGWVVTVVVPLVFQFRSKNKKRGKQ